MTKEKTIQLLHNGPHQVLNIPQEFELSSDEVLIHKEGDRLIISFR